MINMSTYTIDIASDGPFELVSTAFTCTFTKKCGKGQRKSNIDTHVVSLDDKCN